MSTSLKTALRSGRVLRVFALGQLCHPKLVEVVAHNGGFDAVWLDQEHAGLTVPQIEEATRAARASGVATFVRLPATDYSAVMRVLEAGAGGLMASMVRALSQVENLVRWAKFHPRGERGVNGTGVDGRYGTLPLPEYFRRANEETVVGVQIEHADAVAAVEEIAAVRDVDFLFVGPADLSQSLGVPGEWDHPLLWQAIERVARASSESGVPWAILPVSPEHARKCVSLGCRMLSIGIDVWAFQRGLQQFQQAYAEFFANEPSRGGPA
jgi:2-dehydro-3-deoxyglucarate aldolase/4-hydroxy-2-oxoheptanedioate aldolase